MAISAEALQSTLDGIAAEYVKRLALRVVEVSDEAVVVDMPVAPELVHGGGVLCGQAILSAADTAMLLAMIARLGGFKPMTTVQLQTSFLRPVPRDTTSIRVVARVLRLGKSLSYGEVDFLGADGKLAAKASTTYALI